MSNVTPFRPTNGVYPKHAGPKQCRWPIGNPRSPDFKFCGCPCIPGGVYCVDHARDAYVNKKPKEKAA